MLYDRGSLSAAMIAGNHPSCPRVVCVFVAAILNKLLGASLAPSYPYAGRSRQPECHHDRQQPSQRPQRGGCVRMAAILNKLLGASPSSPPYAYGHKAVVLCVLLGTLYEMHMATCCCTLHIAWHSGQWNIRTAQLPPSRV